MLRVAVLSGGFLGGLQEIFQRVVLRNAEKIVLMRFPQVKGYLVYVLLYHIAANAVLLVEQGLGCAICLDGALSVHGDPSTQFLPITPERMTHSVLVWKKDRIFGMSCLFMTPDTSRVQGLFYARGEGGRR